jgi:hypothetical protein
MRFSKFTYGLRRCVRPGKRSPQNQGHFASAQAATPIEFHTEHSSAGKARTKAELQDLRELRMHFEKPTAIESYVSAAQATYGLRSLEVRACGKNVHIIAIDWTCYK